MAETDSHDFSPLLTGARGDLAGWLCRPCGASLRGGVVIVHGLGEHVGRYRETAAGLAAQGFATLAYDQQGHGRSPGRRGAPRSYDSMLEDLHAARADLHRAIGDLPQVLLGHSMGGNLAVNYALRCVPAPHASSAAAVSSGGGSGLAALVLSGPMLLPADPPGRNPIFLAWLVGRVLRFVRISSPVRHIRMTSDEELNREDHEDPLMHDKLSLHLATELLAQGRWVLDHAGEVDVPMLVLHGEKDPVTDAAASRAFCVRAGDRAEYVGLPDMLHEILREVGREAVIARIADWLSARVPPPENSEGIAP